MKKAEIIARLAELGVVAEKTMKVAELKEMLVKVEEVKACEQEIAEMVAELSDELRQSKKEVAEVEVAEAEVSDTKEEVAEGIEGTENPIKETEDMEAYLATFVRANRCTVQATEEGYVVHFYRTHKHVADIVVKTEEGAHSNALREQARVFAIGQCPSYEIVWDPDKAEQAWERKHNTYLTDAEVAEDALTLVAPTLERLADKSRYDMIVLNTEVSAITPKESTLGYVENGRYTKSGAWCVADIELTVNTSINGKAVAILYGMEIKSGQICKPKTTIAEWNELVARELELQGITIEESKELQTA